MPLCQKSIKYQNYDRQSVWIAEQTQDNISNPCSKDFRIRKRDNYLLSFNSSIGRMQLNNISVEKCSATNKLVQNVSFRLSNNTKNNEIPIVVTLLSIKGCYD